MMTTTTTMEAENQANDQLSPLRAEPSQSDRPRIILLLQRQVKSSITRAVFPPHNREIGYTFCAGAEKSCFLGLIARRRRRRRRKQTIRRRLIYLFQIIPFYILSRFLLFSRGLESVIEYARCIVGFEKQEAV